jgi:hypothetical protein
MITILRVELRRLITRRLVRVVLVLAVIGITVAGIVNLVRSHDLDPTTRDRLERRDRNIEACLEGDRALPRWARRMPAGERDDFCRFNTGPFVEDPRFHLSSLVGIFEGTSSLWVIAAWLVGASFVGAEWHTGNMATTLTWEPRRIRLLAAKIAACALGAFLATMALQTILGLALTPAAVLRGSTEGLTSEFWTSLTETALRIGGLGAIAAILGFSVASLGRNTGAALGAGFAYFAVIESGVRALRPQWSDWLVTENAGIFITANPTVFGLESRNVLESALTLVAYGAALAAAAVFMFQRRDVT